MRMTMMLYLFDSDDLDQTDRYVLDRVAHSNRCEEEDGEEYADR